jgi:hypothetical protein
MKVMSQPLHSPPCLSRAPQPSAGAAAGMKCPRIPASPTPAAGVEPDAGAGAGTGEEPAGGREVEMRHGASAGIAREVDALACLDLG